jgi:hypothetical protein
MQTEIGRQMRSEYELPRELPNELSALLNKLLALPATAAAEPGSQDRRRKLLQRAMACEEAAGKVLNEGVKEIYLDLAAQWRDLARQHEFLLAAAEKHK